MINKVFVWKKNLHNINLSDYTHIKVYHACRPTNIGFYIKEGIRCFSKKEAYKKVLEILLQCGVSEEDIMKCFNENWDSEIDHFNHIFVCVSKKELLSESGQYLKYGSEFISGIAAALSCQDKLNSIGVPTLIECDIAVEKIPNEITEYIGNNMYEDGSWDGGICLLGEIEPNEIVGYIQPKKYHSL